MDRHKPHKLLERSQLRRKWIRHAAGVFERMFDSAKPEEMVTFTQREQMACALGKELSSWLLQEHTAADPMAHPAGEPPRCPKCNQPGLRVAVPKDGLPQRELTSLVGDVKLQREQWHCSTCRVAFFPT